MQLRIDTQQRRDLLRTALTNFLSMPPAPGQPAADQLFARMSAEARVVLREIASEEQKAMQQRDVTNPVMAGIDRTTSGAIGQP